MSKSNHPAADQRLRAYLESKPEYSPEWELLQHCEGIGESHFLDCLRDFANASGPCDIWGFGVYGDFDGDESFYSCPERFDEWVAIAREHRDKVDDPFSALGEFVADLYFFALKVRAMEALREVGIKPDD